MRSISHHISVNDGWRVKVPSSLLREGAKQRQPEVGEEQGGKGYMILKEGHREKLWWNVCRVKGKNRRKLDERMSRKPRAV